MMLIVHPRVSSFTLQNRQADLENFLITSAKQDHVEPQTFWEFREFYAPGSFSFPMGTTDLQETHTLTLNSFSGYYPFLFYSSPDLQSTEYLVHLELQDRTIPLRTVLRTYMSQDISDENMLFFGDRIVIAATGENRVTLWFEIPGSEMKKTIGFFDFTPEEDSYVRENVWVDQTTFRFDGPLDSFRQEFTADKLHPGAK